MKQIVIATDGSPSAQDAVDVGLELAKEQGADVTFVHVTPPDEYMLYTGRLGPAQPIAHHEEIDESETALKGGGRRRRGGGNLLRLGADLRRHGRHDRGNRGLEGRRPDRRRLPGPWRRYVGAARQRVARCPPAREATGARRQDGEDPGRGDSVEATRCGVGTTGAGGCGSP